MSLDNPLQDYLVYVGRFQPPHLAHVALMEKAFEFASHLIIVIGSINAPAKDLKNPFSFEERCELLKAALGPQASKVTLIGVEDLGNEEAWARLVVDRVEAQVPHNSRIGLLVCAKDAQVMQDLDALGRLSHWTPCQVYHNQVLYGLHATALRQQYFTAGVKPLQNQVPAGVYAWLERFEQTPAYQELRVGYLKS